MMLNKIFKFKLLISTNIEKSKTDMIQFSQGIFIAQKPL